MIKNVISHLVDEIERLKTENMCLRSGTQTLEYIETLRQDNAYYDVKNKMKPRFNNDRINIG